jgi:hypothetical protein
MDHQTVPQQHWQRGRLHLGRLDGAEVLSIDTVTGKYRAVEPANLGATGYFSDGRACG